MKKYYSQCEKIYVGTYCLLSKFVNNMRAKYSEDIFNEVYNQLSKTPDVKNPAAFFHDNAEKLRRESAKKKVDPTKPLHEQYSDDKEKEEPAFTTQIWTEEWQAAENKVRERLSNPNHGADPIINQAVDDIKKMAEDMVESGEAEKAHKAYMHMIKKGLQKNRVTQINLKQIGVSP